jgi:hypothetical protein
MEKTNRKILIYKLEISQLERHRQFEIKLPANLKKIKGVIITVSKI